MRRAIEFEDVATCYSDTFWIDDYDHDCIDCDFEEDEPDELVMVGRLLLATPTLEDVWPDRRDPRSVVRAA